MEETADSGTGAVRGVCAICQTEILETEATRNCPDCDGIYHEACWEENRGCAVYGCPQVPATEHRKALEIPPAYWGRETKPCPACGSEILAAAVRCRQCGTVFTSAEPVAADDFYAHQALETRMPTLRRSILMLLVFCIMPCSAPLGLMIGGFWYLRARSDIAAMPALWQGLAKIGLAVAAGEVVLTGVIVGLRMILV